MSVWPIGLLHMKRGFRKKKIIIKKNDISPTPSVAAGKGLFSNKKTFNPFLIYLGVILTTVL